MLDLEILQARYVLLSLVAGAVVMIALVLLYLAMWEPRRARRREAEGDDRRRFPFLPWVLILMVVATLLWMVAYAVTLARHPPNW